MVDPEQQFELKDTSGETVVYANTVGTSETIINKGGQVLQNVIIASNNKSDSSKDLQFRFSATDAWFSLGNNCILGWTPKETDELRIRGATASTAYQIIANWEHL